MPVLWRTSRSANASGRSATLSNYSRIKPIELESGSKLSAGIADLKQSDKSINLVNRALALPIMVAFHSKL